VLTYGDILLDKKSPHNLTLIYDTVLKNYQFAQRKFTDRDINRERDKRRLSSTKYANAREKSKFIAFYKFSNLKMKAFINKQCGLKYKSSNLLLNYLESQIHVILYRAQIARHTQIKELLRSNQILVNFKTVKGIQYHVCSGDLITINYYPNFLIERLNIGSLLLLNSHIIFNYGLGCLSITSLNNENKPFFFFDGDFEMLTNRR
jgi:ribosomal protein S4